MCGIDVFHLNFESIFDSTNNGEATPKNYILQSVETELESLLSNESKTSDAELLSFMRCLHLLVNFPKRECNEEIEDEDEIELDFYEATNWEENDDGLMETQIEEDTANYEFSACVVRVLFKLAYCYQSTKEICYKEGNSILFAICASHPKLITVVLEQIELNLDKIGKKALQLSTELPFNNWLLHLDIDTDLNFVQKCLLNSPTNSIMFRIGLNCIDNLNLSHNPKKQHKNSFELNFFKQNSLELIDKVKLVKVKLIIILYELHSRLTIYNYLINQREDNIDTELSQHYAKLAKEKRLNVVTWIWNTISRFSTYINLETPFIVEYMNRLAQVYSPNKSAKIFNDINLYNLLCQVTTGKIVDIKCPVEAFLVLTLSKCGHDLSEIFDRSLDLLHVILTAHKKNSPLHQTAYSMVFNWFEKLLFKYSIVKLKKAAPKSNNLNYAQSLLSDFRIMKNSQINKLSELVLIIFNPSSPKIIDTYCAQIYRRLIKFSSFKFESLVANLTHRPTLIQIKQHQFHNHFITQQRTQNEDNLKNYLILWFEVLISSIKNWQKYKNIVRMVDFLVLHLFNSQIGKNRDNHEILGDRMINVEILDEFMAFVRADFGIAASLSVSNYLESAEGDLRQWNGQSSNSLSNWLQPSFNWISNSLSYVVNTTATQITGTLGAAIGKTI